MNEIEIEITEEYQALRLERLIASLKEKDPIGWGQAEATGSLDSYMRKYLWLYSIDSSYLHLYQTSPTQFQIQCIIDKGILLSSTNINYLNENRYRNTIPFDTTNFGVVDTLLKIRSPVRVVRPMRKLQMQCIAGAFVCMGISALGLVKGKLPTSVFFAVGAMDLQTISYNCYDKRYGEIYLNNMFGSLDRGVDTVMGSLKTLVGISPMRENPLMRLCREIDFDVLVTDTYLKRAFDEVGLIYLYIY